MVSNHAKRRENASYLMSLLYTTIDIVYYYAHLLPCMERCERSHKGAAKDSVLLTNT